MERPCGDDHGGLLACSAGASAVVDGPPCPAVHRPRPRSVRRLPAAVVGSLREEWQRDRNLVYYLLVSAVFRDGLAGIFAFGAVLGVSVYGLSQASVLIFGVVVDVRRYRSGPRRAR